MYEGAQRAFADDTAMHPRDDASGTRKCDINDCQYQEKRLCCSCFRYLHMQRLPLDPRHDDSSKTGESALRGL
jgi:hypothetical protein